MPRTGSRASVLSSEVLQAALSGLEARRRRLDEQIAEIRSMLGSRGPGRPRIAAGPAEAPSIAVAPKKRRLSAAAKKRIAEAQKKRWTEFHKKQKTAK